MRKCPNCGQPTARTEDWACQWCGYPLTSDSYKKIPKTFKQLQEERQRKGFEEEKPEEMPQPRYRVTPPEPVSESIPEPPPRIKPETSREAELERIMKAEPVAPPKIEPSPQPRLEPMPPQRVEPTPTPEPELAPPPRVEAPLQPEVEPAPAPRIETAPPPVVPVLEAKAEPAPEAAEPDPEAPPGVIGITVQRLCADHKADRPAAMARFKDQVLRVSGSVGKVVVRDELGIRYAILNGNSDINVRCTFDPQYANRLMKLTPKQRVIVQGKYDGYERNILLKDCILVSP